MKGKNCEHSQSAFSNQLIMNYKGGCHIQPELGEFVTEDYNLEDYVLPNIKLSKCTIPFMVIQSPTLSSEPHCTGLGGSESDS